MTVWLNVAEKPSVAKEIAHTLSRGSARTISSKSRYNPVFEFTFDNHTMLVTSVAGHLLNIDFVPTARSWHSFPFKELFGVEIVKSVKSDLKPVQENLKSLAKRATTLVLWLDCDREGENIAFEVVEIVLSSNMANRMEIKRAHFSALTERDLFFAVRHLKSPDRRLSDAVEARQEMDLRIGATFTRFLTIKFRRIFGESSKEVLSFGPCQFPTLGFVVRRYWEQRGFVAEDFYNLMLEHHVTKFKSSRGRIFDQITATLIYHDMCELAQCDDNKAMVLHVTQHENKRHRPVPLNTVMLQKLAATHLHLPAAECMSMAEKLYQEGFISYPRTETDSFTFTQSELLNLVRLQTSNPTVGEYASMMLSDTSNKFRMPLRGGHDDHAHPPIHPTKLMMNLSINSSTGQSNESESSTSNNKKSSKRSKFNNNKNNNNEGNNSKNALYLLIVRHFLACLSIDAIGARTSVEVCFGGELFTTSGMTIVEEGWLAVYPYVNWNSSANIPNYKPGETFTPTKVHLEHGRTCPPQDLSETDLIALMDYNGIGTDATIAQHIDTILTRKYVERRGRSLVPTPLGLALASAYEVVGLGSLLQPFLRAQMELAMNDITSGHATREQVVYAAVRQYKDIFIQLEERQEFFYKELIKYIANENTQNYNIIMNTNTTQHTSEVNSNNSALLPPPQLISSTGGSGANSWDAESIVISRCMNCTDGELCLVQTSNSNNVFLKCKRYPVCSTRVFFPRASRIEPCANPVERCTICHAVKLVFEFTGSVQPVPGLERVEKLCVFCHPVMREYITIKHETKPANNNTSSNSEWNHNTGSNAGNGGMEAVTGERYTLPSISLRAVNNIHQGAKPQNMRNNAQGKSNNDNNINNNVMSTGTKPLCHCKEMCIERLSNTERTRGRRFFKCATNTCNYFQ